MMMLNESKPPSTNLLFKPTINGLNSINGSNSNKSINSCSSNSNSSSTKKLFNSSGLANSVLNGHVNTTSIATSSKVQLSSPNPASSPVANQVVIIHQNNSISTNYSSQSSSGLLVPVLNMNENQSADSAQPNDLDELKYMKGYVSVLKERFTRKSLETDNHNTSSNTVFVSSSPGNTVAPLPANATSNGNNDFLRRRSVSPFTKRIENSKMQSEIASNSRNISNSNNIAETKKLFASTDDLRNQHKGAKNSNTMIKNKIKYLSNSTLNTAVSVDGSPPKCVNSGGNAYLNEKINREEMPKPNFVSSVKNLFEKQIIHTTISASLNNSLNNSSMSAVVANSLETILIKPSQFMTAQSRQKQQSLANETNSNAHHQYDSLLDKLRQNGTLVYEHTEIPTYSNDPTEPTHIEKTMSPSSSEKCQIQYYSNSSSTQVNSSKISCPSKSAAEVPSSSTIKPQAPLPPTQHQQNGTLKPIPPPLPSTVPPPIKKSPSSPPSTNSTQNQNERDKENNNINNNINNNNNNNNNNNDETNFNSESNVLTLSKNINSTSNGPNRYLTIKERKEFFSKKQVTSNANNTLTQSPLYEKNNKNSRNQKRLKVENNSNPYETNHYSYHNHHSSNGIKFVSNSSNQESESTATILMENEVSVEVFKNGQIVDLNQDESTDVFDGFIENGESSISANQIYSSAKQKQLDKESNAKTKTGVKLKTFFGGEEIKNLDELKSMKQINGCGSSYTVKGVGQVVGCSSTDGNSVEYFNFEFIGAGVKLEKSILMVQQNGEVSSSHGDSNRKKKKLDRVGFIDTAETFEYPSYEFLLKEMGIDPTSDPDYQIVPFENGGGDEAEDEKQQNRSSMPSYMQFLPGLSMNGISNGDSSTDDYDYEKKLDENLNNNKSYNKLGSFTNFKPSWHNINYKLGSMESIENDRYLARTNGTTQSMYENEANHSKDILPSKDDEVKRWSCDMDSNILF